MVSNELKIYPNPVAPIINLVTQKSGIFEFTIQNMLGQIIFTKVGLKIEKENQVTINLISILLPSGVYYLQLKGNSGLRLRGKFEKE